jgi:hypothetical protein
MASEDDLLSAVNDGALRLGTLKPWYRARHFYLGFTLVFLLAWIIRSYIGQWL